MSSVQVECFYFSAETVQRQLSFVDRGRNGGSDSPRKVAIAPVLFISGRKRDVRVLLQPKTVASAPDHV